MWWSPEDGPSLFFMRTSYKLLISIFDGQARTIPGELEHGNTSLELGGRLELSEFTQGKLVCPCSITANQLQRMADNVIDFQTWHALQLWTVNLSLDRAFAAQLHWSLPLHSLCRYTPSYDEKGGSNVDAASAPSKPAMMLIDAPMRPATVAIWAPTSTRNDMPMLPDKQGCNPAQRLS